ncbi:MAG TPA: RsmD family RNA methyltransferase, partial [Candidatus Limnocylindrales bacterium]|nr:RsmD family RNA methyltransferase [Candidatus Limnocylindrales bacterium]
MADAGRVIAGTARSIRLDAPGPGTRPLGDRVKQTLFAILEP